MKPVLTLSLLVVLSSSLTGQSDFFTILATANEKHELVHDVRQIKERTYELIASDGRAEPDTVLTTGGESVELFLSVYQLIEFQSPVNITTISYDHQGNFTMKVSNVHNPDGRMLSETLDLGDSPAATFMNSEKRFSYDASGRFKEVKSISPATGEEKGGLNVSYRPDGLPDEILADAGMGKFHARAKQLGDTVRYDFELKIDPEMEALLPASAKKQGRKRTDVLFSTDCSCYQYFSQKADAETGQLKLESLIYRDKRGQILREQSFDPAGEVIADKKYTYLGNGKLLTSVNLLDDSIVQNEYFENGKIKVEYDGFTKTEYVYDARGNVVSSLTTTADDDELISLTVREIEYK
ncbi:MAG: hypothetical protein R3D58_21120 [Saprospiraceae bacterium]|jgi:hypothetical protein|nr:hypothetical protein [Lewinellaceae bacterium]